MKGDKLILLTVILTISILLVSCKSTYVLSNNVPAVIPSVNNNTPSDSQAAGANNSQATTPSTDSQGFDTSKGATDKNGCYDTEGGKFYEKKGYIIDAGKNRFEDTCVSASSLREYYCGPVGFKTEESYTCPNGCVDGACVKEPAGSVNGCVDSDFKDYYKKGFVSYKGETIYDSCKDLNTIKEQICTNVGIPSEEEKYCKSGCLDGACKPEATDSNSNCADSDFGSASEFTKGKVTDPKGEIEDSCLNSRTVKEWKCSNIGFRTSSNIECANSCIDGACVR